jgi:hypothetical protein
MYCAMYFLLGIPAGHNPDDVAGGGGHNRSAPPMGAAQSFKGIDCAPVMRAREL